MQDDFFAPWFSFLSASGELKSKSAFDNVCELKPKCVYKFLPFMTGLCSVWTGPSTRKKSASAREKEATHKTMK